MPSAKRVSWAQLKVGIMAIIAMVILGVLIVLLTGEKKLFARKAEIYTYMDDSAALAAGAPVRLNGIVIGSVEKVALSGSSEPLRIIRIELSVDRDYLKSIPVDSIAAISAENVLGTKYINIKKGRSPETVKQGGELKSLDTRDFDEVVASGYALLISFQGILKRIDAIVGQVESGKGSIGKFLQDEEFYNRLTATVAETQKVAAAISSGKGTVGKLLYDEGMYNDMRSAIQKLDAIIAQIDAGQGTAGKLVKDTALYDDARSALAEIRRLLADLNAGKGTAGKLLHDEELYRQFNTTLGKIDTTLDKVNSGQGTLGQLFVNPSLYESLNGSSQELHELLKDIRANPKKFLRIKLGIF